jgi:4-hydroxy-tetrahydrodipicolinate synthase
MRTHVNGVYAALLIPRDPAGAPDEEAFRRSLEFLLARGVSGVALNGATGEYCHTTPAEVERLLAICRETLSGRAPFLCGIGAPGLDGAIALGRMAISAGAAALLLPMPYFFRYSQDDLRAFCSAVAAALPAPILLYNLPKFTNPLEAPTVEALLDSAPNIVGMKDSSGSLELLRLLGPRGACRIVGDDGVLVRALDEGVCDGVVSGVAGVLPELIRFLFHERQSPAYASAAGLLAELIGRLSVFPTPWGLKLIAECRGMAPARFFQPLSEARRAQAREFQEWFGPWWAARRA